ncbi:MAG: radical SAM protein [Treponema sp.]|nr:radical SAM protein [Treponema sp.]
MIGLKSRAAGRGADSLLWVDDFWKQAGKYIFCREDDGVLILPPNRVYKINKTGAALIAFLKNGGKAKELAASARIAESVGTTEQAEITKRADPDAAGEKSRLALIGDFFRTLAGIYGGDLSSGSGAGSPDILGNVKQVPFDVGYTRLPVLGEIAVTYRSNNRCVFCYAGCNADREKHNAGFAADTADTANVADTANGAGGADELSTADWKRIITIFRDEAKIPFFSFTGGEPLLRADLEKLVKHARDIGLAVNLVSNGTLAGRRRAASLYRAGLRTAQISIEAPDAETHDALAGRKGAFAETVRGIAAMAAAGISVQTNTTITRKNISAAPEMPAFLASLRDRAGRRIITRFAMNMYIPGTGPGPREDLFVGYDEIGPVVDEVRRRAFQAGLGFYWYSPTPFCYYNPIARGMGNKNCAAADGLVSVAADGGVLPCSSWNEPLGNILTENFGDIWFSGRALFLKHKNAAPVSCRACSSFTACQGACPLYWRARGTELLEPEAACSGVKT